MGQAGGGEQEWGGLRVGNGSGAGWGASEWGGWGGAGVPAAMCSQGKEGNREKGEGEGRGEGVQLPCWLRV